MYVKHGPVVPYQADEPINCDTKSVVFPIHIDVKGETYTEAVKKAGVVIRETEKALKGIESPIYMIEFAKLDHSRQIYKTCFDLHRGKNGEYCVHVVHYMFIAFFFGATLMDKVESIARIADGIRDYISSVSVDKSVEIYTNGERTEQGSNERSVAKLTSSEPV